MSENPFLTGNFAPVEEELTAFDLDVTGEIRVYDPLLDVVEEVISFTMPGPPEPRRGRLALTPSAV